MKILIILLFFISNTSFADKFNSPFLDFSTPTGWSCEHLGGSWTCNSPKISTRKGIIVVTSKKVKLGSSLKTYMTRLQRPIKREWNKKIVYSQPQSIEEITIRNHNWIQATHLNSEIPNGTTKYLVTIKNGLSVLVSFSAHNDDYAAFSSAFIKSIESLKLNPKLSQARLGNNLAKKPTQPQPGAAVLGNELDDLFDENPIDQPKTSGGLDSTKKMGIIGLLLLAGVFLVISKKRKKKS